MTMIQLFNGVVDKIDIDIMAFIDDKSGDLIIEGCNSSPDGGNDLDSDEEYWLRILKDDKAKLFSSFGLEAGPKGLDTALLKRIAKTFNTSRAFEDLRAWCGTHGVPATFSSYT